MEESFSFLSGIRGQGFVADFVPRVAGINGSYDKAEALQMLEGEHRKRVQALGYEWENLRRAEQVHGNVVAEVNFQTGSEWARGADGLMTNDPKVVLGIYVADCGIIYLADRKTGAVALLHSGKKGTEQNILAETLRQMKERYGTAARDIIGALGPCIRPPHYEIDFAKTIREQAMEAGITAFRDCGECSGSDLERFYSYRMEKGKTGRMLGLLAAPR